MHIYVYYIDTCCCFGQAPLGIQGIPAAMEKRGLLDHPVRLVRQDRQGNPVQVEIHRPLHGYILILTGGPQL